MAEPPTWTPDVSDVAAYVRSRTKVAGGFEIGTFTDPGDVQGETRPTKAEVEGFIRDAVDDLLGTIGGEPCNDTLKGDAKVTATLWAAVSVETTLAPESTENPRSAASALTKRAEGRESSLADAVAEECGGQGTGGAADGNAGALAAGGFNDGFPLIGRDYPPRW
jgi:hypothetical protein